MDSPIRVLPTERHLDIYSSHNHLVRQLSPESRYCKVALAEDWSTTMDGRSVLWQGPPYSSNPIPGKDVCRGVLMGGRPEK